MHDQLAHDIDSSAVWHRTISYWMIGFQPDVVRFSVFLLIAILLSLAGQSYGLLIGCLFVSSANPKCNVDHADSSILWYRAIRILRLPLRVSDRLQLFCSALTSVNSNDVCTTNTILLDHGPTNMQWIRTELFHSCYSLGSLQVCYSPRINQTLPLTHLYSCRYREHPIVYQVDAIFEPIQSNRYDTMYLNCCLRHVS